MTRSSLARSLALLLVCAFLAPAAFMMFAPRAQAVTPVAEVGPVGSFISGILGQDTVSAIKNTLSAALDISNTAANVAKEIKAYVLDPLAFIMSGNLLKSITSSILGFVGGNNGTGKPLYVQNLQGYVQNVGDVQAFNFLSQFSRSSNSPFASAISSSLRTNYLQETSLAGFFAANRNTLGQASSNPTGFLAGDWSLGGVAAWFSLTTQCQNNPYCFYYTSQNQMARSVQGATSAKLAQLNWGQGFLSWCGSVDAGAEESDYYDVDCPEGSVHAGAGGCADTANNQFVLPTDYSCPSESFFDGNSGGCQYDDGTLTYALDADGYPATEGGSSDAALDFADSGDPYEGEPDTAAKGDGTSKVSAASGISITSGDKVPYLVDLLGTASAKVLPAGYRVVVTSAERNTNVAGGGGKSQHASGNAVDFKIIDASGASIPNRGEDTTGWYQKVAVAAYQANNSGSCNIAWGGCFETGKNTGVKDPMHLDCGGDRGRYCSSGLAGLAEGGTTGTPVAGARVDYIPPSSTSYAIPRPGDACTKSDGTEGRIQTPGSIIKDHLSRALNALGIDQFIPEMGLISTQISGIMSNIATVMQTVNLATSLFGGSSGGLEGFSGTSSYDSPFADYLDSSAYLGLTTQDVAASENGSTEELWSRASQYEEAWIIKKNTAQAAKDALLVLKNACSTQAGAADTALSVAQRVLDDAVIAAQTVTDARAFATQVEDEGAAADPAYPRNLTRLGTTAPSLADVVDAQQDATALGGASADPVGSLTVSGGTTADRMNLIKANADAIRDNSSLCPPPVTTTTETI